MKFVTMLIMVALLGAAMRYLRPVLMKSAGLPVGMPTGTGTEGVHFSSKESDLLGTVFKSATRLFTGQANRKELAGELGSKLYAGRGDAANVPSPATSPAKSGTPPTPAARVVNGLRSVFLTRLQNKAMANPELALAPVVLTGMLLMHGVRRRRRSPLEDLVPPDMTALMPSDSAPHEMTNAVHALKAEDFELLVALVYQRQGYRVSMPAGLSGGRGGDFLLLRESERLLVQCKNQRQDFRLPIERVRELQESVAVAGATRGLYVTSCGFTWEARNYAKAHGITVINARTLDALITEAREDEDEDLLAVARWAPEFMTKVKLTPPTCPTCEAEMEQIGANGGTAWVCSQRPECRGRRNARSYQNVAPSAVQARAAKFPTLAKITKSIGVTKLARPVNFTKLTKLAPSPKPVASATPVEPAKPGASTLPMPTTPEPHPASEPEEPPHLPARLLAAFPSPHRLALVTRRIFSSHTAPSGEARSSGRGNKEGRNQPAAAATGKRAKI